VAAGEGEENGGDGGVKEEEEDFNAEFTEGPQRSQRGVGGPERNQQALATRISILAKYVESLQQK